MVGTPRSHVGVVAEGHDAGRVGIAVRGEFLHRDLRLAALHAAAEGHQHRRAADRRVEHLHEAPLRDDIVILEVVRKTLGEGLPRHFTGKGIAVFHRADPRLGIMLRPGAVDEFALEVHDLPVPVEHPHARRVRHVGHVHRIDVLLAAVAHELLHVLRLDHHRHAFLRLADGEFRGVQTAVLGLHAVEVDVQPVGQFADGDADAARSEIVRFLDEARHPTTAPTSRRLAT